MDSASDAASDRGSRPGPDPAAASGQAPAGDAAGLPGGAEPALHPSLQPLFFLIGRWEGAGVVGYPTLESDQQFGQEISFSHNGKPFLSYASRTWLLDADGRIGRPLAMETGYWRPQPDGQLEVVLAHPTGIAEIYLGQMTGTRIEMATDAVVRTSSAKDVTAGRRLYGLIGTDLAWAYDMAAVGQPLQAHASAQLKRVE
ncbi:MAG TPA: FABP family protein [Streptosporangiaceae bacterium]